MDDFHRRHSIDDAEGVWSDVRSSKLLAANARSFLVHDLGRLRARIGGVQRAFPEGALHAVAIKANPLVEVLRVAVQAGAGLEAASIEEVHLALAAGCPPERIVFDSPAKTVGEIREALRRGLHVNADNFDELRRIETALGNGRSESVIGLRVTPEVGQGRIVQTSVGAAGSRFGESITRRRDEIVAWFARAEWLRGLHVHVGSQGCDLDTLCDAVAKAADLWSEIERRTGRRVDVLDVGGGLPAAYAEADDPPTPQRYAERLRERIPRLFDSGGRLVTEFGRSIQAGCGLGFSRVEFVRPEQRMAVIHLGADFLLRPAYRPDDWRHEFFVLDAHGRRKTGPSEPVTLLGPLCFSGDVVARGVPLPVIEPGDWVVVRDCGAYTLAMWSRHCSRGIPAVLGYDAAAEEPVSVLRDAESPADVVAFWSRSRSR